MGKGKINLEVNFKSVELSYRQNMTSKENKKHSTPMVYCKPAPPLLGIKYFNKCFINYLPFISRNPQHSRSQEIHIILFVTATVTSFSNCKRDLVLENYCCGN